MTNNVNINTTQVLILKMNKKGELQNAYSPLQNLLSNTLMGDFTTKNLNFDRYNSVDILVTPEYDGSTNVILNDDINYPRVINNRFSVQENNTFNIPVHNGNAVTNIYDDNTFEKDTLLLKLYSTIPTLKFNGITEGGGFSCGSYVFYFKLADADGNLTNVVQESGIVQVHVGTEGDVKIRMGMNNENTGKCISLTLSNIDAGFDYVRIFYERTSTDDSQAILKQYFMIGLNFPVINGDCNMLLTGEELTVQIDKEDLRTEFADIQSAKTLAIVDNVLFLGNVSSYELDYPALQSIAWKIIPSITTTTAGSVGTKDYNLDGQSAYYNVKTTYNKTGYWGGEFYRFGIVFIYNNNILSPVFNIQGCNLENETLTPGDYFQENGNKWENEPEDYFFNKTKGLNSKGIVKLPTIKPYDIYSEQMRPNIVGIKFDWSNIIYKDFSSRAYEDVLVHNNEVSKNPYKDIFLKYNIKGFFFVRLKRIPTIISQGMVVGLTDKDYGCIPVIKTSKDTGYTTKSFLHPTRMLVKNGSTVKDITNAKNKALLIPDYDVNEATLNQIFTSLKFQLEKIGNITITNTKEKIDSYYANNFYYKNDKLVNDVKLTAIPKNTKRRTDGENYFSSVAGNPDEAYKTSDVKHVWNKTKPLDLSVSTSLIRGIWGSYVGMSSDEFEYGDVVNIRLNSFKDRDYQIDLEFQKRFSDNSFYSAISPRINISDYYSKDKLHQNLICYRGDCFLNVFTHRMMSNFIDSELPTNQEIIDPACWGKNYLVRCTAEILSGTHSNLTGDSAGFYLPSPLNKKSALVSLFFHILTGNIGGLINDSKILSGGNTVLSDQDMYANEVTTSFEVCTDDLTVPKDPSNEDSETSSDEDSKASEKFQNEWLISELAGDAIGSNNNFYADLIKNGLVKKVEPKEQESQGGLNLKAIFKSDDKYELHGLASINRADVNAVSFGLWITFPICSSYNLALRDIDFNQATEETKMNRKRAFYPYEEMDPSNHLVESSIINGAAKVSISNFLFPVYKTNPYIKQEFFNRIYWSKPNIAENYINSYRMIFNNLFREYNKEFGAITKILPIGSNLFVVYQHGIQVLPVNKSPLSQLEQEAHLPSKSVLPEQGVTESNTIGSMWKDSIILTPIGTIYGVDTVTKCIWLYDGLQVKSLSDNNISKFLNDNINLSEYDFNAYLGHINVKAHYNLFKNDVIFTYYKDIPLDKDGNEVDLSGNLVLDDTEDPKSKIVSWKKGKTWSICYNEILRTFTTFYDWIPVESCNLDSIYFSFDKDEIDDIIEDRKIDKCIILRDNDGPIHTIKMNKVFMDKAFTHNVNVYNNINTGITATGKYLSFYYNQNSIPNITGSTVIFNESLNSKYPDWKFIVLLLTEDMIGLLVGLIITGKITEIRFHTEEPSDLKDPVLKYWNYRNTEQNSMYLWKHGLAGLYDNQGKIKPTNWYNKQHEWNVEFIINESPLVQKIFNNLLIISNKTAPYKFEYEVVGEGYDWYIYKEVIGWIWKQAIEDIKNDTSSDPYHIKEERAINKWYKIVLSTSYRDLQNQYPTFPDLFGMEDNKTIKKLPYLKLKLSDSSDTVYNSYTKDDIWKDLVPDDKKDFDYTFNSSETCLIEDEQLNELKVHTESLGLDIKKYGRLRGNMEYLEDNWKVEIRPVNFKYAFISNEELTFTRKYETRHRDKFMRVKLRYDGKDIALIQSIVSMFDESYA